VYIHDYFQAVEDLFAAIRSTQADAIFRAGLAVATSMSQKGVIHVMDTGHLLRHEAFYRAGGLMSIVPFDFNFSVESPVVHRPVERTPEDEEALIARRVGVAMDSSNMTFGDVLIINSNSGRTTNVIEAALQCDGRGICTIGIASSRQMERCAAVHPSGLKLFDVCDFCIDNCGPFGDAMVEVKDNEKMCPASGMAAAYILWAIQAEAVDILQSRGINPSIFRSVHVSGEEYIEKQRERFFEQGV